MRFVTRLLAVGAIVLSTSVYSSTTPTGAAEARQRHCVETVAGAEYLLAALERRCFPELRQLESQLRTLRGGLLLAPGESAASLAAGGSNTIGRHYTSTGLSGSSVTIVGTTCGGGVWRPSGYWDNNIESSRHYCGGSPTTFYDSYWCSGWSTSIFSASYSLGGLNDRSTCIRYG